MNGQHFVYFVGGPLDLTKRSFPGDEPSGRFLRFPLYPDMASYHDIQAPERPVPMKEVTYELMPVYGSRRGEYWVAVVYE